MCPDLTGLHVDTMKRRNRRGGFTENGLSYLFYKCTRLEGLGLDCQSNLTAIPSSIGGLASLKSLHITDRGGIALLPVAFTSLHSLTHLVIEMYGLDELPQGVGNLRLLKSLHLNGCMRLGSFPDSFGQLTNLTHLSISGSRTRLQLPESISNLSSLVTLEISNCSDLSPLPESFGNMPALESLPRHQTLVHLPHSITLATALKKLALEIFRALQSLPEDFGQLTVLETLRLVKLPQLSSLPASLGNLTSLKELKIAECSLLTQLPDSLSQLSSLELLQINDCCKLRSLPHGMGDGLHSLCRLYLLDCTTLTHVPRSFSSLASLRVLAICEATSLRGTLPGRFSHLTSLKELYLSSLNASLPAFARTLTRLVVVRSTRIKALPQEIGRLGELVTLKLLLLPNLKLLPHSMYQLPRLKSLQVSSCSALESLFGDKDQGGAHMGVARKGDARTGASGQDRGGRIARLELASHTGSSRAAGSCGGLEKSGTGVLLPSLEVLELAELPLQHLGAWLGCLPSLTSLQIFHMDRLQSLPDSISRLSWMQSLEIIHAKSLLALPESMGKLSALTSLHLNGLMGLTELPESLG
ncbi:unnamed protein product [Closterium sp. Yama58-4]|nr:unnamed protein product [Closterium sp. Yama58-4]